MEAQDPRAFYPLVAEHTSKPKLRANDSCSYPCWSHHSSCSTRPLCEYGPGHGSNISYFQNSIVCILVWSVSTTQLRRRHVSASIADPFSRRIKSTSLLLQESGDDAARNPVNVRKHKLCTHSTYTQYCNTVEYPPLHILTPDQSTNLARAS